MQMATLASALGRNPNYTRPIRCQVLAVSTDQTYEENGQVITYRTAGLAQGPTSVKATIDAKHFAVFTPGNYIAIKGYKMSDGNVMIVEAHTRIYRTGPIPIDTEAAKSAHEMVHPPSITSSIDQIQNAAPGSLVTINATVVDLQTAAMQVRGRVVPVLYCTVQDTTATIDIALWKHALTTGCITVGKAYLFTHMSILAFNNERRASSTHHTTITGAPLPEVTDTIAIVAGFDSGDQFNLVDREGNEYSVEKPLLRELLRCPEDENLEESFSAHVPLGTTVTLRGHVVIKFG